MEMELDLLKQTIKIYIPKIKLNFINNLNNRIRKFS